MFPSVSPKQSFPALESEVLAYWKANNTFQKSIDSRPEDNPYRFYDGPPFITGTPHYGSLLSSVVKDVVGRYWTMRGKRVDRIWGWDCHGLPIEEKVQKKLGLKSNREIEERGVKEFIDGCYEYTAATSAEWDWYIDKIGRWVDMDNAYRTMDQDYMESVMWVFSQLWNKGLIYEGKRVSLYSWKLGTPISNFEVAMDDTYQEVNDPAITVKFKPEIRKVAGIIVENEKGEILLGHNKKGYWGIPAGKAEEGETHEVCATRELFEEVGIRYQISEKDHIEYDQYDVIGGKIYDNQTYRIFIKDSAIINGEPEKFHEWKFFALDNLPEATFEPLLYTLGRIKEQKTLRNYPLSILAWTTTPWTIPANMALAVRNDIEYVLVSLRHSREGGNLDSVTSTEGQEQYIVAKNRAESVFKGKGEYTIIREFKGSELVGLGYMPPFPEYYYDHLTLNPSPKREGGGTDSLSPLGERARGGGKEFKIYHADFITDTDGTGIGHEAPEFGDVDFQLAKREGIFISEAMDEAGKYTSQIFDYEGTHYLNLEEPEKGANRINIERMKANNTLFKLEGITHRVPFCPRSGTPLMQKAQASWFIDIQSQKEKLLKANEQINWFPEHLKFGRFAKGIESAPDWCISRTRYWGAPMPVWQNKDGSERVVISSRDEIFERNKPYGQLTKLIITRHAECVANVEGVYDDIGTSPLSQKGYEQAKLLTYELKDSGVDIIITSPFLRAIQTAEPLADKLKIKIITTDLLLETKRGNLENARKTPEIRTQVTNALFGKNKNARVGETGESYNDIKSRLEDFIEHICQKYPGKTVFVVTHGYQFEILRQELTGKDKLIVPKNADTMTYILDVANKKQLNLHKPYIDNILLAPKSKKSEKKVLAIHGKESDINGTNWQKRRKILSQQGIELHMVQFDRSEDPTFESWKETFDTIDFSQYDTVFTSSLGGQMISLYLLENGIKIPRIIMCFPGMGKTTEDGLQPNLMKIWERLGSKDLSVIADKIFIFHAKDDTIVPFDNGMKFAEQLGAKMISFDEGGHNLWEQLPLIGEYLKNGTPKKVLGVQGYLKNESIIDFFEKTAENLQKEGIDIHCPKFELGETVHYDVWEQIFLENIEGVDTVFTHSLGCRFSIDTIIKHQISLKKLILIAPPEGKHPNLKEFYSHLHEDVSQIRNFVDEVIVLYSTDDKPERLEATRYFIEQIECSVVKVDGFGHFNVTESKLIEGLVLHGEPLVRIPEVLDVWMDSGSMPYAQVHFPFAGFEDPSVRRIDSTEEKEACLSFFEKMWKEEFDIDFRNRPHRTYEWIRDDFMRSQVYTINEGGMIISSIQISEQVTDNEYIPVGSHILGRVGTLSEFRGKGYGTKLIKKALSDASKKGITEIYVGAEVDRVPFYTVFGFVQIQDKPKEKGNGAVVVMKKSLSKSDELQSLTFPADFIAEYVGQVRAWFYVMHVLGVLLNPNNEPKPTPSFTNVITTGVINGNDGRKMSKSFGNYPDPRVTIEKYGADPIRFYMLNSPLLSGGDMDFKEEQIIETVKGVMLPIWNTYSFFTTYANIDNWQHDGTEIWCMRHAETTSNASNTMSDGTDDPELTEKGREEAKNAGKTFLEQGKNFDIIIHTGLKRTDDTARIVGAEIGFSGEYSVDTRFIEQAAGEYAGKTLQQIADMHGTDVTDHPTLRSFYKNNSTENIEQFEARILAAYEDILERYRGKRILIVAHAGTARPILHHYFGRSLEDAHYNIRTLNAEPIRLMTTPIVNPLDRWILSKLQVLLGQVHDAMDGYDISRACRSIVDYMDEMTNWYVRLSRRRFWGSEMTPDKASAYETLYTVLVELSKLLAPYMPFLSEAIYRGLTDSSRHPEGNEGSRKGQELLDSSTSSQNDENSVHLQYITRPSRHLIDNELNRDMEISEHIVSLGLALRSRRNIRVRQPLQSITITKELSEYYQAIIRDELNVKEVNFENPERLAKKICKPDARKIGPKYGKDVQKVIMEAKNGNFIEKENGIIDVGGFILEPGEYILEYLPLEGVGDVEGGYGMVISLDTVITDTLQLEGYARDLIRTIQDMRKEANYNVTDRVDIAVTGGMSTLIIADWKSYIERETLSKIVDMIDLPDIEKKISDDEIGEITLQIKR